jgi:thiosulfate dehydrogenase
MAQMEGDLYDYPPEKYQRTAYTEDMHISRGGQLYDNWWKTTVDTMKPEEDLPLWKTQSSNKRKGYATYRCKECHGWDYLGRDGAYSKGSHFTGFIGVYEASRKMSVKALEGTLRGSTNKAHDFTSDLSEEDISDLALFMKKGIIDTTKIVSVDGNVVEGDSAAGRDLYRRTCMTECHGKDGTALNAGKKDKPVFIGTLANKNPWEFIHKSRAGQPGTRMSSGIIFKWGEKDIRDLLTYSRTLPKDKPKEGFWGRIKQVAGLKKKFRTVIPKKYRGFGPKKEQ